MFEETIHFDVNTQVTIVADILILFLILSFYLKFRKKFALDSISAPHINIKRKLVLIFTSLIFTMAIMLAIFMAITAICKNMLLTANGLFPNANVELFHQIFPAYNEEVVLAFMFTNYIPIVRTCLLCFLPLYLMIELNYWAVKPDWTEASPHIRLFGKIIHSEKNQKNTRFICRITSIFLIIILPIFMFYFV